MPMWFSFFWWNGLIVRLGMQKHAYKCVLFFVSEQSRNARVCCKGLDGTNGG